MLRRAPEAQKLAPRFAAESTFASCSLPKLVGVIAGEFAKVNRGFAYYFLYV